MGSLFVWGLLWFFLMGVGYLGLCNGFVLLFVLDCLILFWFVFVLVCFL